MLVSMRNMVLCAALGAAGVLRADQLQQILERVSGSIQRLPNYTCLETIDRTRRGDPCPKCTIVDRVRLEVGVIGGKERFAFPGAGNFEDKEIDELVNHWAIGSGDFATFLQDLFVSRLATYSVRGEERRDGVAELRYDYTVTAAQSGYSVRSNGLVARVGYHGSFWVDAESFELKRLEVSADKIPRQLLATSVKTAVDYAPVMVGSGRFVLPQSTELEVVGRDGIGATNRTRYTACSQFVAESQVRFDTAPVAPEEAANQGSATAVPPGLKIEAKLLRPIRMAEASVGDPVEAVVSNQVKRVLGEGHTEKGAVLHGRILQLEIHDSGVGRVATGGGGLMLGDVRPDGVPPNGAQVPNAVFANPKTFPAYTVVSLQFSSIETGGRKAVLNARLSNYSGVWQSADGGSHIVGGRDPAIQDRGEAGLLFFPGRLLEMKKGFGLYLVTSGDK